MNICCCSLAGTDVCRTCSNNPSVRGGIKELTNAFVITLYLDMFDFDEEQVIAELREMIEQVYGGD